MGNTVGDCGVYRHHGDEGEIQNKEREEWKTMGDYRDHGDQGDVQREEWVTEGDSGGFKRLHRPWGPGEVYNKERKQLRLREIVWNCRDYRTMGTRGEAEQRK